MRVRREGYMSREYKVKGRKKRGERERERERQEEREWMGERRSEEK